MFLCLFLFLFLLPLLHLCPTCTVLSSFSPLHTRYFSRDSSKYTRFCCSFFSTDLFVVHVPKHLDLALINDSALVTWAVPRLCDIAKNTPFCSKRFGGQLSINSHPNYLHNPRRYKLNWSTRSFYTFVMHSTLLAAACALVAANAVHASPTLTEKQLPNRAASLPTVTASGNGMLPKGFPRGSHDTNASMVYVH